VRVLGREFVVRVLLAADSAACSCLLASLSFLRPTRCAAMVRFLVGLLLLLLLDCCCWVVFELLVATAPGLLAPVESVLNIAAVPAAAAVAPSRGDCSDLSPYVLLSGSIYNSPHIQTKALLRQYIDRLI